jgi:protein ImuA
MADLTALRAHIRALERLTPPPVAALPLFPAVDAALPSGGLPLACLHQIQGEAPATAFAALIAGRLAERFDRPVLWAPSGDDLYPPGLTAWGLSTARLIVARGRDDGERLWVMEEGLRCADLACVVAEVTALDLTSGRRLQLAAEAGAVTGLVLHPPQSKAANAGTSRWRVMPMINGRWRLCLERCRGGMPREWEIPCQRESPC